MPDQSPSLLFILHSLDQFIHCPHLVRSEYHLLKFIILPCKEYKISKKPDNSLSLKKHLDERLKISFDLLFPVEEQFSRCVPCAAVVIPDDVGQCVDL